MRDFSQHRKLVKLNLSSNQITDFDPSNVPVHIEEINLNDNQLSEVRDFSQHKKLKRLNLNGNEIIKICETNIKISFWQIDTLGEKYFESEHGFKHLKKYRFTSSHLKQPPQEVFVRGLKSVRSYFKDMALSKRVMHSRKRYVFSGIMHCVVFVCIYMFWLLC